MNVFKYFVASLLMLTPTVNTKAQGWKNPVVMSGQQSYDVGDPQVIKYRGVYYLYCSSAFTLSMVRYHLSGLFFAICLLDRISFLLSKYACAFG